MWEERIRRWDDHKSGICSWKWNLKKVLSLNESRIPCSSCPDSFRMLQLLVSSGYLKVFLRLMRYCWWRRLGWHGIELKEGSPKNVVNEWLAMWYRMGITGIQLRQWSWWSGETCIRGWKCKLCCWKCIQAGMSKCFCLLVHLLFVPERPPPAPPLRHPRKPSWCYYGTGTPTQEAGWLALLKLLWLQQWRDGAAQQSNTGPPANRPTIQLPIQATRCLTSTSRPTLKTDLWQGVGGKGRSKDLSVLVPQRSLALLTSLVSADPFLRPLQFKPVSATVCWWGCRLPLWSRLFFPFSESLYFSEWILQIWYCYQNMIGGKSRTPPFNFFLMRTLIIRLSIFTFPDDKSVSLNFAFKVKQTLIRTRKAMGMNGDI